MGTIANILATNAGSRDPPDRYRFRGCSQYRARRADLQDDAGAGDHDDAGRGRAARHNGGGAMAIMTDRRIRHLPVVDKGKLAGVVSIVDLVKQISQDRKYEIQYLTDYITGKYPG